MVFLVETEGLVIVIRNQQKLANSMMCKSDLGVFFSDDQSTTRLEQFITIDHLVDIPTHVTGSERYSFLKFSDAYWTPCASDPTHCSLSIDCIRRYTDSINDAFIGFGKTVWKIPEYLSDCCRRRCFR